MAAVRARYASQGVPTATTAALAEPAASPWVATSISLPVRLPSDRTEYYNAGVRWSYSLQEGTGRASIVGLTSPWKGYRAGQQLTERRNGAVFGPAFPAETQPWPWVERDGDVLLIDPPLFSDNAGWAGHSPTATARIVLYRDGERIADEPATFAVVEVPPEPADYRVEVRAARDAPSTVSTRVDAAWTFRSGSGRAVLPVSAVWFRPELDDRNTAAAGKPFVVPFTVVRQAGAAPGSVRTVTVDVSYDDGATWQRASVERRGSTGVVRLRHPAAAGFVSLRASATDSAGNSVTHTVIRAYRLG
jgi:hypothetical protein